MAKAIEAKFLKGLTITVLQKKKIRGEDGEEIRKVPVERDLTPEDVLDWKDTGDAVVIVTADGQKARCLQTGERAQGAERRKRAKTLMAARDKDPDGKGKNSDDGKGKGPDKKGQIARSRIWNFRFEI